MRLALIVCGSLSLIACTSSEPSSSSARDDLIDEPTIPVRVEAVGAEIELDARSDGARLVGVLRPTPQDTDADRVLDAELRSHTGVVVLGPVLDARFVASGIVLVDPMHTLVLARDGARTEIDRLAEAPLAVRGDDVVYARGDMPFFELAHLEASSGVTRAITEGFAPAYSPAIDSDGSVVFVSSREGRPRLHRVRVDGTIEALAPTQRAPSSPHAPRLDRGRLTFEDERGTTTIDVSSGREVSP